MGSASARSAWSRARLLLLLWSPAWWLPRPQPQDNRVQADGMAQAASPAAVHSCCTCLPQMQGAGQADL